LATSFAVVQSFFIARAVHCSFLTQQVVAFVSPVNRFLSTDTHTPSASEVRHATLADITGTVAFYSIRLVIRSTSCSWVKFGANCAIL